MELPNEPERPQPVLRKQFYEDAPLNYLIDYAFVNGGIPGLPTFAQLLGLDAAGEKIFYYQYPDHGCNTAYNSIPIHLENTKFPTVGPQALNLSTRGLVSVGDNVLIGGFIITGTDPKTDGASRAGAIAQRLWAFRCAQPIRFSVCITLPALSSQPTTTGSPIQTTL